MPEPVHRRALVGFVRYPRRVGPWQVGERARLLASGVRAGQARGAREVACEFVIRRVNDARTTGSICPATPITAHAVAADATVGAGGPVRHCLTDSTHALLAGRAAGTHHRAPTPIRDCSTRSRASQSLRFRRAARSVVTHLVWSAVLTALPCGDTAFPTPLLSPPAGTGSVTTHLVPRTVLVCAAPVTADAPPPAPPLPSWTAAATINAPRTRTATQPPSGTETHRPEWPADAT